MFLQLRSVLGACLLISASADTLPSADMARNLPVSSTRITLSTAGVTLMGAVSPPHTRSRAKKAIDRIIVRISSFFLGEM